MKMRLGKQDLKDVDYLDKRNCAVARHLKRMFPRRSIIVGPTGCHINQKWYWFGSGDCERIQRACETGEPCVIEIIGLKAPKKAKT